MPCTPPADRRSRWTHPTKGHVEERRFCGPGCHTTPFPSESESVGSKPGLRNDWTSEDRKDVEAHAGWLPEVNTGCPAKWVDDIAYEFASICDGDSRVMKWVRNIKNGLQKEHLMLSDIPKWRSLDLILAREINRSIGKTKLSHQSIKGNLELLRKRAMLEERVAGGREMIDCIIKTIGSAKKRSGVNDLMKIETPNARSLEKFYIEWRNTEIETEIEGNMEDVVEILEQKMEDSKLFDPELRTISMWPTECSQKYRMLLDVIDKRVQKSNKKDNVPKETEQEERKPTRREKEQHSPERERLPYTYEQVQRNNAAIESYFAKGKGKGKSGSRMSFNPVGPPREPFDHVHMEKCRRHGACYRNIREKCMNPDCLFRHMTMDELNQKEEKFAEMNMSNQ